MPSDLTSRVVRPCLMAATTIQAASIGARLFFIFSTDPIIGVPLKIMDVLLKIMYVLLKIMDVPLEVIDVLLKVMDVVLRIKGVLLKIHDLALKSRIRY